MNSRRLLVVAALVSLGFLTFQTNDHFRAAEDKASLDWQLPNESLKTPFEKQVPIHFVSRGRNKAEWESLKGFWNETTEKAYNPATGLTVQRKAIKIKMPLGLNVPPSIPIENPMTLEGWKLGKRLYFDPLLSSDGTVSCATCHAPDLGFADRKMVSLGIFGSKGGMNAPSVTNSAFNRFQFWDGRGVSLEDQAQGPVGNNLEMFDGKGVAWDEAVRRVRAKEDYNKLFLAEFGHLPTRDSIAKAIATYERTVLIGNSIVDCAEVAMRKRVIDEEGTDFSVTVKDYQTVIREAFEKKDIHALTALGLNPANDVSKTAEVAAGVLNGQKLFFNKARCNSCHVGESLTDHSFHNLGVGSIDGKYGKGSEGRYGATQVGHKNSQEFGAFKTPQLRGILDTAPYMHDGSEKTLEAVIDFYDRGGNANPFLDQKMRDLEAEESYLKLKAESKPWTGEPVKVFNSLGRPIIPKKLNLTPPEKKDLILFLKANQSDPVDPFVADPKR